MITPLSDYKPIQSYFLIATPATIPLIDPAILEYAIVHELQSSTDHCVINITLPVLLAYTSRVS
jgi:hypothetical protein